MYSNTPILEHQHFLLDRIGLQELVLVCTVTVLGGQQNQSQDLQDFKFYALIGAGELENKEV